MKKVIAVLLVSLSLTAQAKDEVSCDQIAELAGVVMNNRQIGVPMSNMWGIAKGNVFIEGMIKLAYDQPQFSTSRHQTQAVNEFKNEFFMMCVQSRK